MDKFIGFDIDHKHTLAGVVPAGQFDRFKKLRTVVDQLREWPKIQRAPGGQFHSVGTLRLAGRLRRGGLSIALRLCIMKQQRPQGELDWFGIFRLFFGQAGPPAFLGL